ncbi:MAG: BrnA antitoxin family protein [Gemmatimonadetes bacterium]|nr:BrnA antitoxin family protein [Gemmatimonadota bacterium]
MTENKPYMDLDSDDDLPDLATSEWQAKFAQVPVQRGRPKAAVTKVSTTIRLDPDVLAAFKADGPGWQTRINQALRKSVGLE